ncbi:MAG: HXXEE domain-containing protein [Archangium sp.]|nr:HXXEE domain-containing protein [Archangium sp.]
MDTVLHDWPLAAPLVAMGLLAWSLLERRPEGAVSRWRDPVFLLPLLLPMYLIHQFEEHGYDVHGQRYAFLASMCRTLGFDRVSGCPADEPFIFAVNVIACPLAFVLPYRFRRTRPLLALMPWGVPLVNALSHLVAAVHDQSLNPGVVTSVLLFLPLGGWVVRVCLRTGNVRPRHLVLVIGSGVLLHVVLMGSVQLRAHGLIDGAGLFLINALNGFVPLALGWWPSRSATPSAPRA